MKRNSKISVYCIPGIRGHFLSIFSIIIFLFVQPNSIFSQTWSMYFNVMVGDTTFIGRAFFTEYLNKCTPDNVNYSHNTGTDFYLDIPLTGGISGLPSIPGGNFMFAPRKVGEQVDTFYVTVGYEFSRYSDCSGKSYSGPVAVSSMGTTDSIVLIRITGQHGVFHHWFSWNIDSNRYIMNSDPNWTPTFELINNVEDSTTFEFKFLLDSSAHFTPLVVIADSQGAFYRCEPKVRRRNGYIIPIANPEGFPTDTAFVGYLQVLTHNSSSRDTFYIKYELNFTAKQIKSIAPLINKMSEQVQIFSLTNDNTINIHTNSPQPQNTMVELFDALGRQLPLSISQLQIPSGTSRQKLDVGNLSSGCYILRMKMKDQVISKSFVVTR